MVFHDAFTESLILQGFEIGYVDRYNYLGVWINEGHNYSQEVERKVIAKANRNAAATKKKTLWNVYRYEVRHRK